MDRLSHGGIVAARILIAVVFVLNGLGIVDQTIPAKELMERGAPVSLVPVIMLAGRVLELAAGFGLALGVFPRLMALALFAFLVPTFVLASCRHAGLPRATDQLLEKYSHLGWSPVRCRVGRATMCAAAEDGHKREGWRARKSSDSGGQKMSAPPSPDPVSPNILLGMTATTGIVDAVSLLALGHVFTANMTGT